MTKLNVINLDVKDHPVTLATVYTDRANVSRTIDIEAKSLKIGVNEVRLSGVSTVINPDSIRVEGKAKGVAILDVLYYMEYVTKDDNQEGLDSNNKVSKAKETLNVLTKQLENEQDSRDLTNAKIQAINDDSHWIQQYSKAPMNHPSPASEGIVSVSQWFGENSIKDLRSFMEFVKEWRTAANKELVDLKRTLCEQEKNIKNLQESIDRITLDIRDYATYSPTKRVDYVVITLEVSEISDAELTISYLVAQAYWLPDYDVRVFSEEEMLKVSYRAKVSQSSGEIWKDAKLVLSTAKPATSGNAPEYSNRWTLDLVTVKPVPRLPPMAARMKKSAPRKEEAYSSGEFDILACEMQCKAVEYDIAPAMLEISAKASEGHNASVFEIPTLSTIEPDGKEHKVTVGIIDLKPKFIYSSCPKLSSNAYLKAKVRNDSDYVFLPGPISVFLDNTFISKSQFSYTSVNEEFEFSLGIDESIKIKYPSIKVKQESAGLFGNNKLVKYVQDIEINNTKKIDIKLRVIDQVPVSSNEKIKVNLVEPVNLSQAEGPTSQDPTCAPSNNEIWPDRLSVKLIENNCVEWKLTIKPNVKQNLVLKYEVSHPANETIAGLP